ncbi:DUF2730 family protein [Ochrobactrum sp. MR28]|nr:DUF2730 family protein [Ochrobactrum sp. MR28]MBX8818004.1 DUF2730 family protein [Ochrobactrum sp. MR31]
MAEKKEAALMNLEPFVPWLAFILSFSALATNVWSVFTSPSRRNAEEIGKIKTDQAAQDRRIQTVEAELKHVPDSKTIHKLELLLEKLNGRLDSIDGRFDTVDEKLKPIQSATERMNDALLAQGRK